jgi:hypothetical protein
MCQYRRMMALIFGWLQRSSSKGIVSRPLAPPKARLQSSVRLANQTLGSKLLYSFGVTDGQDKL